MAEAVRCPVCDGAGEITKDGKLKKCHGCDGKGWVEVGNKSAPYPKPTTYKTNELTPPLRPMWESDTSSVTIGTTPVVPATIPHEGTGHVRSITNVWGKQEFVNTDKYDILEVTSTEWEGKRYSSFPKVDPDMVWVYVHDWEGTD